MAVAKYRGYIWKGLSIYVIFKMMNAIYDCGIYARFFVYGPFSMRKVLKLNPDENFAAIQSRLFLKFCAQ